MRILDEVTQAEEAVAPSRSELHGELRIATSHTFMTTHLSTILAGFIGAHPGLSLDISTEDRQINMHQPDFDIAIRLGLVPDSTLIARTLARNLTWLCASPDYLAQRGTPVHPVELEQHDGLLYTHRAPGGCWQLLHNGQRQNWRVRNRLRSDNAFSLLEAAKAGLGIVVMPLFLGADAILRGELNIILPRLATGWWQHCGPVSPDASRLAGDPGAGQPGRRTARARARMGKKAKAGRPTARIKKGLTAPCITCYAGMKLLYPGNP
ncbi:LysR family transcriptional regulator [Enterobacter cloacae]|uniref:LysR family transcriptional regulator n=1 Tax=Enterobacter cloacae TaxID=550 RepID=A0A377LYE6_ENTCL|nr:LysR family transcriptional regulator [Enterobacter cloacae]